MKVRSCEFAVALWTIALCEVAVGCRSGVREVVVYTSIDQVFSEPILREYERRSGVRVRAVFDTEETKSTGVLNRIVAEARSPQADVFWSGDPVRPFVLVRKGLVEPYRPAVAEAVPAAYRGTDGTWTGGAARARLLLVNRKLVSAAEAPRSVRDLADPRWKGRAAIANPVFGTTTMHVAALAVAWGDAGLQDFLRRLKENEIRVASSNGEVKRLVASGEVAVGLADTDDAAEALKDGAPVDVVYPDQDGMGTLVMPTAVVLLKGPRAAEGRGLVDYLLSPDAEARLVAAASHHPLRPDVVAPEGVPRVGSFRAMAVDYGRVAEAMERLQPWLREWAGL